MIIRRKSFQIILITIILLTVSWFTIEGQTNTHDTASPAQSSPAAANRVSPTLSRIKVDGVLSEPVWQRALKIPLQYEYYPGENIAAEIDTDVLITYGKHYLYVAFRCFDPHPEKIRAHYMERDDTAGFAHEDMVIFYVDTFNDERRSYKFQVNPLGVQVDGFYGEEQGNDYSWDAVWKSAGKITDFGYTVEIAVPYHQLRAPKTDKPMTWGFSARRYHPRSVYRRFSSNPVERNKSCNICQFNKITGFQGITPGRDLEISPTLTGSRHDSRPGDPSAKMDNGKIEMEPGLNLRWGISSNYSINAAVNPDFSTIEADAAQLHINRRFVLQYPEKRPFFLEGADYFKTPIAAVFTRSIADPLWGIKFSGKSGKNSSGVFLANDRVTNLIFPSNQGSVSTSINEDSYSAVLRYKRDIGKGSSIGALYTGRMGDNYSNHVVGADGYFRLSKTTTVRFQYLHSETDYPDVVAVAHNQPEDAFAGDALYSALRFKTRSWLIDLSYKDISDGFRSDNGFISRADIRHLHNYTQATLWGKKGGWFTQIGCYAIIDRIWDHNGLTTDSSYEFGGFYYGPFNSFFDLSFSHRTEFYNGVSHDLGQLFSYFSISPNKKISMQISLNNGKSLDYVNDRKADSISLVPGVILRLGRHLNLDLNHTYERLSFKGTRIYTANLTQSRVNFNLNTQIAFRCILQYRNIDRNAEAYTTIMDTQSKKLFTQLLFSYRVNPQTVFFLGYSDNRYGTQSIDLYQRDRTFFLKIGYSWMI